MASGVFRLTPIPPPSAPSEAPRSEAPSLHRRYPVSTVLLASPTPSQTAAKCSVGGRYLPSDRASHVAQRAFPTCRSHYPGGLLRGHLSVGLPRHDGLPRI